MNGDLNPQDIPEEQKKDIPSDETIVLGNPATQKKTRSQLMKEQMVARKDARHALVEEPEPEPKVVRKKAIKKVVKKVTKKVAKKAVKKPTKK